MFEATISLQNSAAITHNQALKLFHQALRKGKVGQLISWISGHGKHSTGLLDLNEIGHGLSVRGRHYCGIQSVPLHNICGTEGRAHDFDASFNPLSEKTRDRWLSVANARLQGTALPAIEVIRVGQVYFVRDGHHRLSVAQAFGEESIDAHVTVWDVRDNPVNDKDLKAIQLCSVTA